jgi:hypothetical protein
MTTDASAGHGLTPRAFHRSRRRPASSPTFSERRPLTGSILTVCLLVLLGALTGIALGKALALGVQAVLGVVTPWSGS